jgi:hypothetical protein
LESRMLMYHPAQDANHCVFRTLLILENTVHESIDIELFRMIDFYTLFPHLLKSLDPLPLELRAYKKILQKIPAPFESMLNTKRILFELESLQTVAFHNLLAKQLIEIESFKSKRIKRTSQNLPTELNLAIKSSELVNIEWFRMVINDFPILDFGGKTGLKKRTGLMEFRYDTELK